MDISDYFGVCKALEVFKQGFCCGSKFFFCRAILTFCRACYGFEVTAEVTAFFVAYGVCNRLSALIRCRCTEVLTITADQRWFAAGRAVVISGVIAIVKGVATVPAGTTLLIRHRCCLVDSIVGMMSL